jgi:FMN phosphatase YigB (HAD superfamily)
VRVVRLQPHPLLLVFDLDNTLYTNPPYAAHQEEAIVARLAESRGEDVVLTRETLAGLRGARARRGLPTTSLGNLFAELGVDMATSVRWREEGIEPERYLTENPKLRSALAALKARYFLALVTNNPRSTASRSLAALGVGELFSVVVGLDDTRVSKPAQEPFLEAARILGIEPHSCVSIGDRFDVDIAPALELGMGGILVDGVEDVYRLDSVLH